MDKRDYFVRAVQAGAYRYKRWIIEAFSVTESKEGDEVGQHPYALHRDPQSGYMFHDPVAGDAAFLEGVRKGQAPFAFAERMTAYPGDLPNIKTGVDTTYGQFLVNAYTLCHAFGDKIPYMNGEINPGRIEQAVIALLADPPKDGEERDPGKIYVDEYLRFGEAAMALEGLATLCVVSATPKTLTYDPIIPKRRKELLEQYAGQLDDPLIQVKIEAELKKIDREWMRGDPGERFLLAPKNYDVVRKKLFLLQGASEGMGAQGKYITGSLSDGWRPEDIPAMVNNLRDGTYSRGASTALGGEQTKFLYRIFQNSSVVEEDCGSRHGIEITLTDDNSGKYITNSIIGPGGKLIELSKDNIKQYVGKTVRMRYPTYCVTEGANYCATCMGKKIETNPNALSSYAASIGSRFMLSAMSAMHGKSLKSVKVDFNASLN